MQEKEELPQPSLLHEFEHFTDHVIPYLVIAIAIVLVLENPFWTLVHMDTLEPWVSIFDSIVVFFFVVDLAFKWFKTRNIRKFFQLYWLDIVAVFPFYLAFRAYAEVAAIFRIGEEIAETGQKVAHEAVLLREARMFREAEELSKEAREVRVIARDIRGGQRLLRALKGRFFASHHALLEIHERHKREHRATVRQPRRARPKARARN